MQVSASDFALAVVGLLSVVGASVAAVKKLWPTVVEAPRDGPMKRDTPLPPGRVICSLGADSRLGELCELISAQNRMLAELIGELKADRRVAEERQQMLMRDIEMIKSGARSVARDVREALEPMVDTAVAQMSKAVAEVKGVA